MRLSMFATLLSMTLVAGLPACVTEVPTEQEESSSVSDTQQAVEVCSAAFGCVLTALRDGNAWLIDTCVAVLCPAQSD